MQPSFATPCAATKPAHRLHARSLLQPLVVLLAALLMFVLPAAASAAFAAQPPEETLEAYLRAIYARDFGTAYGLIAQADREMKTKRDYLRENGAFSGAALDLTTLLAEFIRFEYSGINIKGQDDATVTFRAIVPDTNDPVLRDLLLGYDQQSLKALSAGERAARSRQLRQLATRRRAAPDRRRRGDLVPRPRAGRLARRAGLDRGPRHSFRRPDDGRTAVVLCTIAD